MDLSGFPETTDDQKAALLTLRDDGQPDELVLASLAALGLAEPQGALTEAGLALTAALTR